jgi:hypothetical protein
MFDFISNEYLAILLIIPFCVWFSWKNGVTTGMSTMLEVVHNKGWLKESASMKIFGTTKPFETYEEIDNDD